MGTCLPKRLYSYNIKCFPELTVKSGGPQCLTLYILICHHGMMTTCVNEDISKRDQCEMHTINNYNPQNLEMFRGVDPRKGRGLQLTNL